MGLRDTTKTRQSLLHGSRWRPVRAAGRPAGAGGRVLSPAGVPAVLRPVGAWAADGTDDRNCQPVAEAIGHRGPHRLQHLLAEITRVWAASTWDSGEGFRWSPAKAWNGSP